MVGEKDFEKVRMDQKSYEKAHMIHYNWYLHSIKAIMGAMGKELMKKLHKGGRGPPPGTNPFPEDKVTFYRCLDQIEDRRDVVAAAQCLTTAKEAHEEKKAAGYM